MVPSHPEKDTEKECRIASRELDGQPIAPQEDRGPLEVEDNLFQKGVMCRGMNIPLAVSEDKLES